MTDTSPSSTLQAVTRFVLDSRPGDIPEQTRAQAAFLLLDTLGICAASAPMTAGVIGRNAAVRLYGGSEARMLFDGRRVSLAGAVFAAATQTDNLDGHDGYNPTKGHAGVVIIPTLAALAEAMPDLAGDEALAALVIGYEIAGRAAVALHNTVSDYHTSGAWNALGVAAMAARLWRQSPEQLRQGLGIAEYHGPRSQMMREIATPTMLHDGSGWGALAGMSAAVLAGEGFTGAPAVTVEAPEAARYWADLGRFWQTDHQYIKPYPICRWAHAPIDAARALLLQHGFAASDVARITIRTFHNAVCLYSGLPDTTSQAQYSLPFAVAAMLVNGRIGLEHISGPGLSDPAVARLVALTDLVEDPIYEACYPEGRWADVTITLTDGTELRSGETHARGGPERPFAPEDITAKYMEFAGPVLGQARAAALRDAILNLPKGGDFSAVAAHLYDPTV
ncbi:MmgE/PrpD family protein [Mesobacterium sp. TK19101]|uniref:MmgE/PrpD family protein n=1 Tax=Mesobacterium hydrothermale TaxID=3111907 RepID=A0ABU6HD81_9RHOB|nr:MmgE/PrpD family protein [Mesobacterium sp. TK19101]MEC3860428.1 MmgE/PrpD family protein [Mesobacterium sp. TK19101]